MLITWLLINFLYISSARSQIKVLTEPPAKPNPTICMPPGMFGAGEGQGSGLLSSAFAQLASALASNSGEAAERFSMWEILSLITIQ